MRKRFIAAFMAAFLLLPAFGVTAYASGSDYFDGPVSVAVDMEDAGGEEDCEETAPARSGIVDMTPRPEEPVSGAVTVTDNTEPAAPTEPATEPQTEPSQTEPPAPQPSPAQPADPAARPFTPPGTGETVDNAAETDGKEFFTITTPDENVFYLVIDRQRETENVYLLDAVTEADLSSLAEPPAGDAAGITEPPTAPATTEPPPEPEPEPEQEGGGGMLLLVLLVLAVGGGAGWYFKIYKPKQQQADTGEMDEEEYGEEPDPYDWPEEADPDGGRLPDDDDTLLGEDDA